MIETKLTLSDRKVKQEATDTLELKGTTDFTGTFKIQGKAYDLTGLENNYSPYYDAAAGTFRFKLSRGTIEAATIAAMLATTNLYEHIQVGVVYNVSDSRTGKIYRLKAQALCNLTLGVWGSHFSHWEPIGFATASELPYTPADTNNVTGFFTGLLATGATTVKLALDRIVEKVKAITASSLTFTTTLWNHFGLATSTTAISVKDSIEMLATRQLEVTAASSFIGIMDIPATEKTKLELDANWDVNDNYIGPPIANTFQGQQHFRSTDKTMFVCVADNIWTRQ